MSDGILKRRYLGLWLPFLSADRWLREHRAPSATHAASEVSDVLVFVEKDRGTMRLADVSATARANGLESGLSLADARARHPDLHAEALDSPSDRTFLKHLAEIATAFTPSVALDDANGLMLDITGCTHLFGSETKLAQRLVEALQSTGVTTCRLAVAPTPDMARALARFAQGNPCFAEDDGLARALPVAALECSDDNVIALKRAGLRTLGEIADRPSVLFTARFSQAFTMKLARILGEEDRRITPLRPVPACQVEHRCAEPIVNHEVLETILLELAADLSKQLQGRGEGGRLFESMLLRTDGVISRIRIETSRPTRDPDVVIRLHRDRFDELANPLDSGLGFDLIRLKVLRSEPYEERQTTLDSREDSREQAAQLVDRLAAMFGRERVVRFKPYDTHIPERAQIMQPAVTSAPYLSWPQARSDMLRPLLLYTRPHPIETNINGNGALQSFRWRRLVHRVMYADGPERISDEWWRTPSDYGTRDYYRVENAQGRRFWIFRAHTANASGHNWYLHGLFS